MATPNLPFVPPSTKRHRTSSQSSGLSSDSGTNVAFKSTRISSSPPDGQAISQSEATAVGRAANRRLICTLPPTCNRKPTPLANTKELESHYATYHAHVCEQPGCGCVFPEARLLELHQTENHDPLAALRKDRGEKIFACHLASCPRTFATPKARRLHLISSHGYPKEYFFAVTNKGVGGLLKKWGEGASMIRGKWKPRDGADKPTSRGSGKSYLSNKAMDVDPNTYRDTMDVDSDDSDDDDDDESSSEDETMTREKQPGSRMVLDPEATPRLPLASKPLPAGTPPTTSSPLQPADPADALTSGFSSLSLVPPAVRFGRGGRNTGFAARIDKPTAPTPEQPLDAGTQMSSNHLAAAQRGRGGGKANTHNTSTAHEIAPVQSQAVPDRMRTRGRGRGIGRGRGY